MSIYLESLGITKAELQERIIDRAVARIFEVTGYDEDGDEFMQSSPMAKRLEDAATARFIDNGDGTITDTQLGLMWSKATLSDECIKHADAEKICAELDLAGHTDWRLPTVDELSALADRSRYNPAIDKDAFPDTHSDWYWTSTPCARSSDCAWIVLFNYGGVSGSPRGYSGAFVRAVRSVPAGQ